MTQQFITRKGSFDAAHRVMHERFKCFNIHGHTYLYALTFLIEQIEAIGYLIDFKEIKRIAVTWIDEYFDHGCLLNPMDHILIQAAKETGSKMWLMSLNGANAHCNPSVENIAKELFLVMDLLFKPWKHLHIHQIRLYETSNCYTDCTIASLTKEEITHFLSIRSKELNDYSALKGQIEYDITKLK